MTFLELVEVVGSLPVFETGLLAAGASDPDGIRRQLSRWVRGGRIVQLRRGLYALAPPWTAVRATSFPSGESDWRMVDPTSAAPPR